MKLNLILVLFTVILSSAFIISGCDNNNGVNNNKITDDEYIKSVVTGGYDNNISNEDNLIAQTISDLNDGYAISDNEGTLNPIDSLKRWGRVITDVNVNLNITNQGDSVKNVLISRTITGSYRIIGIVNGHQDSISKPYTEVFNSIASFKRINSSNDVTKNWRLYKISMLNGGTTEPQVGISKVEIEKIEMYFNGNLQYTFNGPDFTQNIFTTKFFNGIGIPDIDRGNQVEIRVYTTSQNSSTDYVAWHWARNSFGFHRIPFNLISQTGNGPYQRVYSKTFYLFNNHFVGVFNGYLSANTHESLYDDAPSQLASHEVGLIYRVTR